MLGHFLEKVNGNITSKKYKRIENKTFFFFESNAFSIVNFRINKSSFKFFNQEHAEHHYRAFLIFSRFSSNFQYITTSFYLV